MEVKERVLALLSLGSRVVKPQGPGVESQEFKFWQLLLTFIMELLLSSGVKELR